MHSIQTQILKLDDLSADDIRLWRQWQRENPCLYSPYFAYEYTRAIAGLVDDVHILVIGSREQRIGFLPFQAKIKAGGKIGFARPIGSPMTDYQGFICAKDTKFDVRAVFASASFGAFTFSSAVRQNLLEPYRQTQTPCTVMDLKDGAKLWREGRDASYRRHLKNNRKRTRKAQELGGIRTQFMSRDQAVFDQLIAWKKEKFSLTGKYDVLGVDWTVSLLKSLWSAVQSDGLRADMHVLYFGDEIAAIDLGLTNGVTFHSWMVAYNSAFQNLAPGIQLLELLIDEASVLGYARIDLGEGIDGYKRHYASEDIAVGSGFIAASGPAAALCKLYGACETFGEHKLGGVGKLPGKVRRRYSQISACEPSFSGKARAMLSAVSSSRQS